MAMMVRLRYRWLKSWGLRLIATARVTMAVMREAAAKARVKAMKGRPTKAEQGLARLRGILIRWDYQQEDALREVRYLQRRLSLLPSCGPQYLRRR